MAGRLFSIRRSGKNLVFLGDLPLCAPLSSCPPLFVSDFSDILWAEHPPLFLYSLFAAAMRGWCWVLSGGCEELACDGRARGWQMCARTERACSSCATARLSKATGS
eukprot:3569890-Rhodomonas_salina.1